MSFTAGNWLAPRLHNTQQSRGLSNFQFLLKLYCGLTTSKQEASNKQASSNYQQLGE